MKVPTPSTSELLAANVKRLRESRGLSQRELADRMEVAYTRISEIEHGRCGVSGNTLDKLADALACQVDELLRKPGLRQALTA